MKGKVDSEELINWWLEKFHNTTLNKTLEEHPKWKEHPEKYSHHFRKTYQVTKEQYDEWLTWAREYTKKITGIPEKRFEASWVWVELDVSPMIKKEK